MAVVLLVIATFFSLRCDTPQKLDAAAFRRAFEQAYDDDDSERIETLLHDNPTQFLPLFEIYAEIWINHNGAPASREEHALDYARAIAEAADAALEVPGLLEMMTVLKSFDVAKRDQLHAARDAWRRGKVEEEKFEWQQAFAAYFEADATLSELHWLLTDRAAVLVDIGTCYFRLGQYEKAIDSLSRALELQEAIANQHDIATSLNNLGACYGSLGQFEKAIDSFGRALHIYEGIGNQQDIAGSLNNLGGSYLALGQFEKAIDSLSGALKIYEGIGNQQNIASPLNNLGTCYYSLGQYEKAIDSFSRALMIQEKIGNQQDIARSLNGLGSCYFSLGQYQNAIDSFSRALMIQEKIGNQQDIAYSLNNLGICYSSLGQYQNAIDSFSRAFNIYEGIGNQQDIARSLNNLGGCCLSLGQYEKAIDYHSRALKILKEIGNQQEIAISLNNLGDCYHSLGQFEKAIDYDSRALKIEEAIGNQQNIARSFNNLGNCYFSLGQYQKAIDYHNRALKIEEGIGNQQDIARSFNNLGACYGSLGQFEKAIDYDSRALNIYEGIGNQQEVAGSLDNLGRCYRSLGQYDKAIDYHSRALKILKEIGNQQDIAISLNNLGDCYHSLGHYDKAIDYHSRALMIQEKIGNQQDIAYSLDGLARSQLASGHPDVALDHFEQCMVALGQVGRRTQSEEGRAAFGESWEALSAEISQTVRDLATKPRTRHRKADKTRAIERGFPLIEALLARSTLEALQERAEHALEQYDPALTAERTHLLNHMTELGFQLLRETSHGKGDADRLAELRRTLAAEEKALEKLEENLRRSNPRLGQLIAPRAASLAEVQKGVLQNDQALLLFVLGDEESFAWVITQTGATIVTLPAEKQLRTPYDALQSALAGAADDRFVAPARELFKRLLAPVWPALEGKSQLIIVPDGFLAFLPFEMLLTRELTQGDRASFAKLPYLLREKSIRYAPSASILVWFAENGANDRGWQKDICLLGDPTYGDEEPSIGLATRAFERSRFARLTETRQEVLAIAERRIGTDEADVFLKLRDLEPSGHVSGHRFDLYVGSQASRLTLAQDLSGYRIVHLAVHGYFDTEFPWFSGLVLSNSAADDSGFLNQAEIATLKLNAEIVFLSACETAKGRFFKADGIRNTARSFLLAGARSVVATQWGVRDDAAPIVAETFYEHLFAGESPAQALREAKIALIEHRVGERSAAPIDSERDKNLWAHPSFWAPFVLFGG